METVKIKMKAKKEILVFIVDDDPVYLKMLEIFLVKEISSINIKTFPTGEACLHSMHLNPDILILDYFLNSEFPAAWDGIKVMKKISWNYPHTNIIILSSQQSIETAMDTINEGAQEYIVKNEKAFPKIKNSIMSLVEIINERSE